MRRSSCLHHTKRAVAWNAIAADDAKSAPDRCSFYFKSLCCSAQPLGTWSVKFQPVRVVCQKALNDVMNHSSMHCTILNCSLDMSLFISFEDATLLKYKDILKKYLFISVDKNPLIYCSGNFNLIYGIVKKVSINEGLI